MRIFEEAIRAQFRNVKKTKLLASFVRTFHQRLLVCNMLPGRASTRAALLMAYLVALGIGYFASLQIRA